MSSILQPLPLKRLTEGLKATKRSTDDEIYKLFTNVLCIHPPKVTPRENRRFKTSLNCPNVSVSLF